MLQFDKETTRVLETVYHGADITRRRQASFDAVVPLGGETIADIGCGNGLLTLELARAVGPKGKVLGVEPSPDMRNLTLKRCAAFDCVEILEGTASALPIDAGTVDKAVSVQVFEYLDDIPAAIAETRRVLKTGGKVAIGDYHFGSLTWHSDHPKRMEAMIAAWDHHFVERETPRLLIPHLRDQGFSIETVHTETVCDYTQKPDGLTAQLMHLMPTYAVQNNHMNAQTAQAWRDKQLALAQSGRFFFSVTHYVVCARKQ